MIQIMLLKDILDFFNLDWFDPIIRMIPLTMIPLSGANYIIRHFMMKESL